MRATKSTTTISIETEVLTEARLRRINISATINNLLKEFLKMQGMSTEDVMEKNKLIAEITKQKAELDKMQRKRELIDIEEEKRKQDYMDKIKRGDIVEL